MDTVFGVPGDFNLALLDHISEVEGLRWAGNTNELNAGYAADGYSRLKRIAALITTFGVGELSALAAVAGSYAEHVGLVHIVGIPSLAAQSKQLLLHHTLGNGDFTVFKQMSAKITKEAIVITDARSAAADIDRAFAVAYTSQRPVYLAIPADLSELMLDGSPLSTPIDLSLPENPAEAEAEAVDTITEIVSKAKQPIILVDACANRHDAKSELNLLTKATNYPVFVTPMGKGMFDERDPQFGGVYVGSLSDPEVAEIVESSDCVLSVGALLSDFNTGSFSYHYRTNNIIEFHSDHLKVKSAIYNGVSMKPVLKKLAKALGDLPAKKSVSLPSVKEVPTPANPESALNQKYLWTKLTSFLQPGDVVITETGTSSFGIITTKFPKDTTGISQILWGSIGYSVGACAGAALAAQEISESKRVILFVGDGSLQLTVTEISTMIRWGLKPYLFILNNDGYTIERLIHGENASYNDVHMWKYSSLLDTFNAKDYEALKVSKIGDIEKLFADKDFAKPSRIRSIEVMLPKLDAPVNLIKQAELSAKVNLA